MVQQRMDHQIHQGVGFFDYLPTRFRAVEQGGLVQLFDFWQSAQHPIEVGHGRAPAYLGWDGGGLSPFLFSC